MRLERVILLDGLACIVSVGWPDRGLLESFFSLHPGRYEDLVSSEISQVLPQLSWRFLDAPLCITLVNEEGLVCATGWATMTNFGSCGGVNLSYAVAPEAEGRGLARYATAMALLCLEQMSGGVDPLTEVHAQCLAGNAAGHAVARALGLRTDPRLDITCRVRTRTGAQERDYRGSCASWGDVRERVHALAAAAPLQQDPQEQPHSRARERATAGVAA